MEKILKKYTTIPQHLYVERSADEQLKNIVEEMQRPGYVLVARQMGKTNLLFNAKRTLENENRLFIYVDLSNLFEEERECYRNIIDNIIEPNDDIFECIEEEIEKIRCKNLPSHKEYSRCLRVILNIFAGDLVIILDEIDALRSADYSDHIFAQIRSNYFSRTNFPEFNRLTYILSGVIEPTELIKDRNKSPFNIGDKIYLDDFTRIEHDSFISKSKLVISNEISSEIFDWTNGNPRLTFDICSEVENYLLKEGLITKEDISEIIHSKYLTSYDIAPIDHIRELVKSNKEVRKAIINIHKGLNDIDDETKKKLYLYGIINSNFNEKTRIKNKVINKSLSIDWLNSLDKQMESGLSYGLAQYDSREYEKAIETFLNFLQGSNIKQRDIETSNYFIGYSYYYLKDFENAIKYFSTEFHDVTYNRNAHVLLGICKLTTGKKDEGLKILEQFINNRAEINDFAYHNALLNLAINQESKDNDKRIQLLTQLYNSTFKTNDSENENVDQLKTIAQYYISEVYFYQNNNAKALEHIQVAKKHASISDSLFLIYSEYFLQEDSNEELKVQLVDNIINNRIQFDTKNTYPISFNERHLILYLEFAFDKSELNLFNKLLKYATQTIYSSKLNELELIYTVSTISENKQLDILKYLIRREDINEQILLNAYSDIALIHSSSTSKYLSYFDKYFDLFLKSDNITNNDIYLLAIAFKQYFESKKFKDGIQLFNLVKDRLNKINDDDLKFESLIIYYWSATLYFQNNDKINALLYADKTQSIISKSKRKSSSMIDEAGLKTISQSMKNIKLSQFSQKPIINSKKYGRNDRVRVQYENDVIKEDKYKRLENDINEGRCKVIEEN